MWIVRLALNRPYTFIVLALLILLISPVVILRTPTDIFPNIDIPVIAVAWNYTGLNPEEMEGRMTTVYERILTTSSTISSTSNRIRERHRDRKDLPSAERKRRYRERAGHCRIANSLRQMPPAPCRR